MRVSHASLQSFLPASAAHQPSLEEPTRPASPVVALNQTVAAHTADSDSAAAVAGGDVDSLLARGTS